MLFPVLQPADWPGLLHGPRVHRWLGTNDEPAVLVAYAWERPGDRLEYVTERTCPDWGDHVVREAFDNLIARAPSFELIEADGNQMLITVGVPFAVERILSEDHMRIAQERLGVEEIVVSIARRGTMLICDRAADASLQRAMNSLHLDAVDAARADRELLYDQFVVVKDGVRVGTLPVARAEADRPPVPWGGTTV